MTKLIIIVTVIIPSMTFGQTDSILRGLKKSTNIIFKEYFWLNESINIEVIKDTSMYKYQNNPDFVRIYINDTTDYPTTIISVDNKGNVIDFLQNRNNSVHFSSDSKDGKLKFISYKNNKGKIKTKRIK